MPPRLTRPPRRLLALGLVFALLSTDEALAAPRALSAADKETAQSAFYFVERDNWREALLHARRAKQPLVGEYMTWRVLRNSDIFNFSDYFQFMMAHPDWPDRNRLLIRAEDKLYLEGINSMPRAELVRWFRQFPPVSGKGKLLYAQLLPPGEETTKVIRAAWIEGDYDPSQEQDILQRYGQSLRQQDHVARIDRLVWEGKTTAASRLFFAVPKGYQSLFEARIRLALNKPGAEGVIAQIPSSLRNDPGLLYERMKWRDRKGMEPGVRELLYEAPANIPFPDKWWSVRHKLVRKALDSGQTKTALDLLAKHGQTEGSELADALWLQGWIHLTKLKQPGKALPFFLQLEKSVAFPVSKSRAAYWAGRSYEAMGQPQEAQQKYATGATYPTTFYGQLCHGKLKNAPPFSIPSFLSPSAQEKQQFEADSRVGVVHMLANAGREQDALVFINHMANEPVSHARAMMVAELGNSIGRPDFSLIAAKESLKQNIILPQQSYPFFRISFTPRGEEALIWAITRQESLFNPNAESSAGAKGLMQLLPSTAKEVARKNDISFAPAQLNHPNTNLQLGDAYINQMIRQFDGSYVMAIAAYNAGPGRVRQWEGQYGHPGKTLEQAIDWIETIPFNETRNYVQRVLENLQVYRVLTPKGANNAPPKLEKDLTR